MLYGLIRFLRNRLVLTAIFTFSLTYFLVQTGLLKRLIYGQQTAISADIASYRAQIAVAEEMRSRLAGRHIQWMRDAEIQHLRSNYPNPPTRTSTSENPMTRCRNTRQGRHFITDEHGFLCARANLNPTSGCCDRSSSSTSRWSCSRCVTSSACCDDFEHCVSCCMQPAHTSHLIDVIARLSDRRLHTFMKARDPFDMCLIKCRTSSSSVNIESKYKNDTFKYCYRNEPDT